MKKPYRTIQTLSLEELSVVDSPAVEPAKVRLLKQKGNHSAHQQEAVTMPHTAFETTKFNALEDAIDFLKSRGLSASAAMAKAARAFPELVGKYNEAGIEAVAKAMEQPTRTNPEALAKFEAAVTATMQKMRVGRHVAIAKVRREQPTLAAQAYA